MNIINIFAICAFSLAQPGFRLKTSAEIASLLKYDGPEARLFQHDYGSLMSKPRGEKPERSV